MRATAGTDVVIDVLVFQRRGQDQAPGGEAWIELAEIVLDDAAHTTEASEEDQTVLPEALSARRTVSINRYFAAHPEMVLGTHTVRRGVYGPGMTYTCRARPGDRPL